MYLFCTYFDHRYLSRGLALYQSLARHCRTFRLWALCLDELSYQVVSRLRDPNLVPVALEELEKGDEALQQAKLNRPRLDYYLTCTPSLPLFILRRNPEIGMISYLDADLFLFQNPAAIFREIGDGSIAVTEHRYSPDTRSSQTKKYGTYNVGWLSFRNDANGLACLRWWRARCLEWCHHRVEDGGFGDQKYLDEWPARFPGVVVLRHQGVNVAPWNLVGSHVTTRAGKVLVNGDPLIVFHFHGIKEVRRFVYDVGSSLYQFKLSTTIRQKVYAPYIRALTAMHRVSAGLANTVPLLESLKENGKLQGPAKHLSPLRRGLYVADDLADLFSYIYGRTLLMVINGHAL